MAKKFLMRIKNNFPKGKRANLGEKRGSSCF